MHRLLAVVLAATAVGAAASPASAATGHCRPQPGEHQLARSAQAVVFERTVKQSQHFPLQTITGCSRRSGKRRVIDTLQRRSVDDPTKLIGLKLAGTRVAYALTLALPSVVSRTTVIADDAVHGGRRHTFSGDWPLADTGGTKDVASWAVDANGGVAWIAREDAGVGAQASVVAWRPGLGRRQVDARAAFDDLQLRDGKLSWRRNGAPRAVDLSALPRSACPPGSSGGTLAVDFYDFAFVCLRATGRMVPLRGGDYGGPYVVDANGPYLVYRWVAHASGAYLLDLTTGDFSDIDLTPGDPDELPLGTMPDAVVDDHGSIAWLDVHGALWARDAAGTRAIPGTGTRALLRDGSIVTWYGGGPTVTLNP